MNEAAGVPVHILQTTPLLPIADALLKDRFTVHRLWEQEDAARYLEEIGPGIRGIATTHQFGAVNRILDQLPNARIISSFGVGYEHIDAEDAARRGIVVTNTPDVLDDDVADLALALTLATLRQIPQADRHVRSGRWLSGPYPLTPTLRGRTVGILGMGRIGKAIARRFEGFGVDIAYHARHRQDGLGYAYHDSAVALAAASDLLVVIVPGGAATRHLVDMQVLNALGPQGVLINVARGSVMDEAALVEALEEGRILAAGLDVYQDEPNVPARLLAMDQLVLLPHVGSATVHTRNAMARLVADNLLSWFGGKGPLTPVPESRAVLEGMTHSNLIK
ncbi:2-hydroxyacid dehydrogenase [Sphingobium sp. DC-2]|uniref:2-hydroxyacid dehydrogenase n=1 Tax=Sphingobium sp. DC-2 TaxID=1303256 RepID=UPI000A7584CC|nr:2-hydroxyacid dehydrogenase [Sphingobium sp. DC-2]